MRTENYPKTVDEILREEKIPCVVADEKGLFTFVNAVFERSYGWKKEKLVGCLITQIMPLEFRDAHHVGFSRFLSTKQRTLLGKSVSVSILQAGGKVTPAEHFILADKKDGKWRFAALIRPILASL